MNSDEGTLVSYEILGKCRDKIMLWPGTHGVPRKKNNDDESAASSLGRHFLFRIFERFDGRALTLSSTMSQIVRST